jgi:hypothetical protein
MTDAEKQMMIVQSEADEVVVKSTVDLDGVMKELEELQKEHNSRVADLHISNKKQSDKLQSLIDEKDTKLEEVRMPHFSSLYYYLSLTVIEDFFSYHSFNVASAFRRTKCPTI